MKYGGWGWGAELEGIPWQKMKSHSETVLGLTTALSLPEACMPGVGGQVQLRVWVCVDFSVVSCVPRTANVRAVRIILYQHLLSPMGPGCLSLPSSFHAHLIITDKAFGQRLVFFSQFYRPSTN